MSGDFFEQAGGSLWNQYKGSDLFTVLGNRSNQTILQLAEEALAGKCFEAQDEDVKPLFHDWLRWVISEERRARAWWHWVHEQRKSGASHSIKDRDEYTAALLRSISGPDGKNREAREQFEKQFTAWSYYEFYFFNWFLNRFHVRDARGILNPSPGSRHAHLPVSLLSLGIVVLFFSLGSPSAWSWLIAALGLAVVLFLGKWLAGIQLTYYLQSLIPRLAALTGLGYLFLLSASDLVAVLYTNPLDPGWQVIISAAIVGSVWGYMILVIRRRVHPRLSPRQAFARSCHLMIMAAAYSAVGLFICKPIFINEKFLGEHYYHLPLVFQAYHLILAAIALAIGVALQLVWEDKPVTEPL